MHLALLGGTGDGVYAWLAFAVGGVLGLILISMLFDWALVILSAIAGAALISPLPKLGSELEAGLFVVLALAGMVIQARAKTGSG